MTIAVSVNMPKPHIVKKQTSPYKAISHAKRSFSVRVAICGKRGKTLITASKSYPYL